MPFIHLGTRRNVDEQVHVDVFPDVCPFCGKAIEPKELLCLPVFGVDEYSKAVVESYYWAVFQCPSPACESLFIAGYDKPGVSGHPLLLAKVFPETQVKREFDDYILEASPRFCSIWQQARQAETAGLVDICGPGYRKALEFLIKDYLSSRNPTEAKKYQRTALRNCIEHHVSDANVKACATRAAILGNDETHYLRDWTDKDVGDLKALVELTLYWISAEHVMESYKTSMPDKK